MTALQNECFAICATSLKNCFWHITLNWRIPCDGPCEVGSHLFPCICKRCRKFHGTGNFSGFGKGEDDNWGASYRFVKWQIIRNNHFILLYYIEATFLSKWEILWSIHRTMPNCLPLFGRIFCQLEAVDDQLCSSFLCPCFSSRAQTWCEYFERNHEPRSFKHCPRANFCALAVLWIRMFGVSGTIRRICHAALPRKNC